MTQKKCPKSFFQCLSLEGHLGGGFLSFGQNDLLILPNQAYKSVAIDKILDHIGQKGLVLA